MSKKSHVRTLTRNTLLLKNVNHHLSLIFLLVEGLVLVLMAADLSASCRSHTTTKGWVAKVWVATATSFFFF